MTRSRGYILLSLLFAILLMGEGLVPCVEVCGPEGGDCCLESGEPATGHNDGEPGDIPVCHCSGFCRCIPAIIPMPAVDLVSPVVPDRYLIHRSQLLPTVAPSPPDHIPLA
jgi:hypothetical protein